MPLVLPQFELARFNTLASPVRAAAYTSVANAEQLTAALDYAREQQLPILPLGGGSNVVLAQDYPGLVIHQKMRGIELVDEDAEHYYVRAGAGENWHEFVQHTLTQGFYGLENLSLIPGSVGAAPIQNIGAYGVELSDVFSELTALNIASRLPVTFTRAGCQFGYRDSVFKNKLRDQYIITSVTFKLSKKPAVNIGYPALRERLNACSPERDKAATAAAFSPQQVSAAVIAIRQAKLPDPAQTPNAGSFFKNPVVSARQYQQLKQNFSELVAYPLAANQYKLAAGWLIEQAGWRGHQCGAVAVHASQALVLTNPGRAPGEQLLKLAEAIRRSIQERYGVSLEIEPRVYP